MAIDIGAAATDRGSSFGVYTLITLENPANENGTITDIEIWAAAEMANCKTGTFYGNGAGVYTNRDYAALGTVASGSKQPFSGLSIDCITGDYIGVYGSTGGVERDTSGYGGVYYIANDQFGAGEVSGYTLLAGDTFSVYGFSTGDVTIAAVLVPVDSSGLTPSLALDSILSAILTSVDSLALTPSLLRDIIFASPLIGVDSVGLTPTISLSLTLVAPLTSTDSEALVAVLNLGIGLLPPVVIVDGVGLVPSLVLDRIFDAPLVVITSKAPTPFEPDTGHLTIIVPLIDIEELGFVPAAAAAIQRILIQATNLRVITSATMRAIQAAANLRKVDR